jgi:hypothetical protein
MRRWNRTAHGIIQVDRIAAPHDCRQHSRVIQLPDGKKLSAAKMLRIEVCGVKDLLDAISRYEILGIFVPQYARRIVDTRTCPAA